MGKKLIWFLGVCAILVFLLTFQGSKSMAGCTGVSITSQITEITLPQGSVAQLNLSSSPDILRQQLANAKLIIEIGQQRELSDKDIKTALAVAKKESQILNLPDGDADSAGIFQQRPSMIDWGTYAQIIDPVHATNKFYEALEREVNRESRTMFDVALRVQKPDFYAYSSSWYRDQVEGVAEDLFSAATGSTPVQTASTCTEPYVTTADQKTGSVDRSDDYPYKHHPTWRMVGVEASQSPLGGLYRECTDFVSWRINQQWGSEEPPFKFRGYGAAVSWAAGAKADGYKVDSNPAVGAIAWWGPGAGNASLMADPDWGHVAIVKAVKADGSITIEQYNNTPHAYDEMDLPPSYLNYLLFLHVADVSSDYALAA